MQVDKMTTGIYAAKALEQHLCKRLDDTDSLHVFILSVLIRYGRKFCIQEVLLHMPAVNDIVWVNIIV
jgi:hypothetical protein